MGSVLARLGMSSTADQNAQTSFRSTSYTASCPCEQPPAKAEGASEEGGEAGGGREGDNVWTVVDLLHQMAFNALLGALQFGFDGVGGVGGGGGGGGSDDDDDVMMRRSSIMLMRSEAVCVWCSARSFCGVVNGADMSRRRGDRL
eukprot:3223485-Rhodomonas_salina.4